MKRYYTLVGCFALLAIVLALTHSSAYWPVLPLLLSSAVFGEMTAQALFSDEARARLRPHKVLLAGALTLGVGLLFNIVLLIVMSVTVLMSLLHACIACDLATLEASSPRPAPAA